MNIRETLIAATVGASLLTTPVAAGGPVIVAEEPIITEARPSSEGKWVLPVVVGMLVIGALASGGGDDPVGKPVNPCKGEC